MLPATKVVNKHMVPILNKPMIMYPIETLKSLGITEIMVVSGGNHIGGIAEFLGDGSEFGVSLTYRVQRDAGGIAQALSLAEDFAQGSNNSHFAVILGDNVFDERMVNDMPESIGIGRALIVTKKVGDPQRFGVLVREDGKMYVEEKPEKPKSNEVLTGLYFYPGDVFDFIRGLEPSARGELEIAHVNSHYLEQGRGDVVEFRGFWSDAGTPESLAEVTAWALRRV